jgi:hypothetical protein
MKELHVFAISAVFIGGLFLLPVTRSAASGSAPPANEASAIVQSDSVQIYKTRSCECCRQWVMHLQEHRYRIFVQNVSAPALVEKKRALGVDPRLASCHTALIGGYVVEGHVPAASIARLLREKPDVRGLVLPGMPAGAPGMGESDKALEVLALNRNGGTELFEWR